MKTANLKFIIWSCLLMLISCEEPETVVTDYVHRDGSVTRVIEMRSLENNFAVSDVQVPYDSTWTVRDSSELLDENGDTMWVRRAEKTFRNIDEINLSYRTDSSHNRNHSRNVAMNKQFRWFNTEYRFSENVGKLMDYGLPVKDFLNDDELSFFYSPEYTVEELKDGPDSLRIRSMRKSIDEKTEKWLLKSVISEFIGQFGRLTGPKADQLVSDLRNKEPEIYDLITEKYNEKFDSLWEAGTIQKDLMGEENAKRYRNEADSAVAIATGQILSDFKNYSVRIIMPGKLTATNGFMDSTKTLLWPVIQDYFLTQPYEMWAESKVSNVWAWLISGVFLLFVLTGVVIRTIKKG